MGIKFIISTFLFFFCLFAFEIPSHGSIIKDLVSNINPASTEDLQSLKKNNFFNGIHGYFDVNGYYDTRSFDVLTVNTLIDTPFRFQYFSFINLFGNPSSADKVTLNKYYTEQDFRYISQTTPVDLEAQYVTATTFRDLWRFGPRWRVRDTKCFKKIFEKLHLVYEPTFFPFQIDRSAGYDAQIEHFYRIQVYPKLFSDRVYISGFFDHDFRFGSDDRNDHFKLVAENQIGIRIIKQLYLVAEHRFNEYRKSKKQGVGIGLEYSFNF